MKHIKCKTKKQMIKVLKKLENDGYRWSNGQKPTDFVPFYRYKEDTVLEVGDKCRNLAYGSYGYFTGGNVKMFIDAEDFVRNEKNRPSIVIFRRGRNVIAKNIATGDEGVAKCSPDDEFVFKTGASIALARLMAKTPEVLTDDVKTEWKKLLGIKDSQAKKYTDADRNFKVGDRVVVREWDNMAKEYGTENGVRITPDRTTSFIVSMRHLCGRTATVTGVRDDDYVFVDFDDKSGDTEWYYKKWMFNPSDDAPARDDVIREGDTVKVVNVGLNYSSYPQWVGKHISDSYMAARYRFSSPDTERKYKVIKIAEHENNGKMLAFIEECDGLGYNRCYLIEVRGLEKV